MKKHSQLARVGFALEGLRAAWRTEASFRTEVIVSALVASLLAGLGAGVRPWLAWFLGTTLVLAAELINSSLEHLCDTVHPDRHPGIKVVKDCASAAVFVVVSGVSILFGIVLWRLW